MAGDAAGIAGWPYHHRGASDWWPAKLRILLFCHDSLSGALVVV